MKGFDWTIFSVVSTISMVSTVEHVSIGRRRTGVVPECEEASTTLLKASRMEKRLTDKQRQRWHEDFSKRPPMGGWDVSFEP